MGWLQRLLGFLFGTGGTPSGGGTSTQSSFHLVWHVPPGAPIIAATATLQVDADPEVAELYFWALQASFSDASGSLGGAHTGLQWHPRFPRSRAVNWGGYHDQRFGGAVLDGTESGLPSTTDDRNTRNYDWRSGTPYRFRISPGSRPEAWRASVTDVLAGENIVIRELTCRGDRLTDIVMWSEVFADCDAPSVTVRWSDLRIERTDGTAATITTVETRYQSLAAGGCPNTNSHVDIDSFLQTTNTDRTNQANRRLSPGT